MIKWIMLALMTIGHFSDLSAKERKASLQALIIYDTSPSKLKTSYAIDAQRIKETLQTIAFHTKLHLQLKECEQKRCSPKVLRTWIQNLPYSSRDVAFVYYAGKPTYVGNKEWPSLTFSKSHKRGGSTISGYDEKKISTLIKDRKPRLSLVMFDCYDQVITIPDEDYCICEPLEREQGNGGLKRLFLKSRGSITTCSTRNGQPGYGITLGKRTGGLFTSEVLSELDASRNVDHDWNMFFSSVKWGCSDIRIVKQRPLTQMNVKTPPLHLIAMSKSVCSIGKSHSR